MDRRTELEKIRFRLWDRFVTLKTLYKVTKSFDQFWYEFLVRDLASDSPTEIVYDDFCEELEERLMSNPR